MSEIQDSAAIIAADMRQLADDIEAGRAIVGQSVWRSYADRVEAIGTGNIAKLRNALELSKVAILVAKEKMNLENPVILKVIDDALAAPARNCDRFTSLHDAWLAWQAYCAEHMGDATVMKFHVWLYDTAGEKRSDEASPRMGDPAKDKTQTKNEED